MRVTIKDIAEMAGVSTATVSMVINAKDGKISEATRGRVMKVVNELGYRPAAYARQMKGKNSRILGLIIPDLRNHFYPELTSGFSDKAEKEKYQVLLLNSRNKIESEEQFVRTLISMSVSGIAFCGVNAADIEISNRECNLMRTLQKNGIAVVQLDRYYKLPDCCYIGIDNYQTAYDMTLILLEKGYKKIVAIGDMVKTSILEDRIRGYIDAMHENGILPSVLQVDHKRFSNLEAVLRIFWENPEKEQNVAIFDVISDIGAIECLKKLQEHGVKIPEDIGVIGFDDIYVASKITPSLTTVSQPKYEMGEIAFDALHEMIRMHTITAENIILPCKYIERESTRNIRKCEGK